MADHEAVTDRMYSFTNRWYVDVLSGASAGIVGTVIGHPFDTVKVRLQTQPIPRIYKNPFDCFVKIVKQEGISTGIFRGMSSPLVGLTILNILSFNFYANLKQYTSVLQKYNKNFVDSPFHYFLAGGLSGVVNSIFSNPFDVTKIRMQLDTSKQFQNSSLKCAKIVYEQVGFKGFYSGFGINIFREFMFCSTYFAMYDSMKQYLIREHNISFFKSVILSGALGGMSAWMVCFPIDVIFSNYVRSSIRSYSTIPTSSLHSVQSISPVNSAIQVAKEIISKEGIRGFYKGLGTSIARACIVSSTRFTAYEWAKSSLTGQKQ